jgi:hypothetical protein
MVFSQARGRERVWVPTDQEAEWIARFTRWGDAVCTARQYTEWRGFFPPHPESVGEVMIYPKARELQRRRRSRLR